MASSNEIIANRYRAYAVRIIQASNSFFESDILKQFTKLQAKIIKRLASSNVSGTGSLTQVKDSARLQQLLQFVMVTTNELYRDMAKANTVHLLSLAAFEAKFTEYNVARGYAQGLLSREDLALFPTSKDLLQVDNSTRARKILAMQVIPSAVEVNLKSLGVRILQLPTEEQLAGIVRFSPIEGTPTEDFWKQQSQVVQRRFESVMRQGLLAGSSNSELIDQIRGTPENDYKDGIFEKAIKDAKTLVRSSALSVMNRTRLEMLSNPRNSSIIKGIQQISTLDSRTSDVCIAYSGKVWSLPDYKPVGHDLPFRNGPPRHWNCRSTLVPVTKSFKELGIAADEIPKGTRATVDGQVSADLSFDQWLKSQTQAFQDDLLGVGKADLWRKGKITLTDLIDQSGRSRSLSELTRAFD